MVAQLGSQRLLVGFHPEPGNYRLFFPPGAEVHDGQTWEFFCPACHADLRDPQNKDLCRINLEQELEEKQVLFSRVAGVKATFVVQDALVQESFGRDAAGSRPKT